MGLMLAEPGYHTRCFVEWDADPRKRIIAAQRAGYFAPAPIWDDVNNFDARPFRGAIDTLIAGYPCQPFSMAGRRRGEDDPRHLWPSIERIITELGPHLRWCFFENVSGHLSLGLDTVLRSLQGLGFRVASGLFSAAEVGAPHERQRVFIVAYREGSDGRGEQQPAGARRGWGGPTGSGAELADPDGRTPGAERELGGGELGFQPQGGGALDDAERAERWAQPAGRDKPDRIDTCGRQATSGVGKPDENMGNPKGIGRREGRAEPELRVGRSAASGDGCTLDHPSSPRCNGARPGAEAGPQGGQCLPRAGRDDLGAASRAEPQGINGGKHCSERRQEPDGYSSLRGRAGIFPPGPSDRSAWSDVLRTTPSRAPAVARRDIKTAALRVADLLPAFAQAAHEQGTGRLEGRDILRALDKTPAELVGAAEAVSELRRMADGLAQRTPALRIGGNGVVPLVAAYAWRSLSLAHGLGWLDLDRATGGGADDL